MGLVSVSMLPSTQEINDIGRKDHSLATFVLGPVSRVL